VPGEVHQPRARKASARAFDEKVESTIFVSKMARIRFNIPTGRFGGQS
jgi:hypothetical protein